MSTVFTNNSRSGWWDIGSNTAYMYVNIDAVFEYGRQYESFVDYTFNISISPKGTGVYYNYPIDYTLYLNGVQKKTGQIKPSTSGVITDQVYSIVTGQSIDGLSASTTSAPWKVVFNCGSGYSCEASGTLTFPAYNSGSSSTPSNITVTVTGASNNYDIIVNFSDTPQESIYNNGVYTYPVSGYGYVTGVYAYDWNTGKTLDVSIADPYNITIDFGDGNPDNIFNGTIRFVNDNASVRPHDIAATHWSTGSDCGTVYIPVEGAEFNYTLDPFGSGYISNGDEALEFHEIAGYTMTTSPANSDYCNKKDVTYTYNEPVTPDGPSSGNCYGTITFVGDSSSVRPSVVAVTEIGWGSEYGPIDIPITGTTTNYNISSPYNGSFCQGDNGIVFPEISGYTLVVTPDNDAYSSLNKNATYTYNGSGGSSTPTSITVTVTGDYNNYDINVYFSDHYFESIYNNGVYTYPVSDYGRVTDVYAVDKNSAQPIQLSVTDYNVVIVFAGGTIPGGPTYVDPTSLHGNITFIGDSASVRPTSIVAEGWSTGSNYGQETIQIKGMITFYSIGSGNCDGDYALVFPEIPDYTLKTVPANSDYRNAKYVYYTYNKPARQTAKSPWQQATTYTFKDGAWKEVKTYNRDTSAWNSATFMVYDKSLETTDTAKLGKAVLGKMKLGKLGGNITFEEQQNDYGTTVIINNYTTEQNEYGTTVIIE